MLSSKSIFIKKKSDLFEAKEKSTRKHYSSCLLQLPNDILFKILFYLAGLEAIAFGNTSVKIRAITNDKLFWQIELDRLSGDFKLNDPDDHHPKRHVLSY